MLVTNIVTINDKEFKHTISDKGFMIKRDNILYEEAFDPIEFSDDRIYEESDILIKAQEEVISNE